MPGFARRAYGQNMPLADVFPFPLFKTRAPGVKDKNYLVGQVWVYKLSATTRSVYIFGGLNSSGAPIWAQAASGTGDLSTLTGTSGGAIAPIASNITFAAGTGMLSIAGTAGTLTFNVNFASPPAIGSGTPAAITGTTVASTGAMTAGTGLTATTGNITASSGNVSASGTVTGGTGVTATTGNITATAGAVAAGTTVTGATGVIATAGGLTATAGNLALNGAGSQIQLHGGAVTDFIGTATLAAGTTGAIANTNIAATDRIIPFRIDINGSTGIGVGFAYTINAGADFTITSLDAAGATETDDVSNIGYLIVRQTA